MSLINYSILTIAFVGSSRDEWYGDPHWTGTGVCKSMPGGTT